MGRCTWWGWHSECGQDDEMMQTTGVCVLVSIIGIITTAIIAVTVFTAVLIHIAYLDSNQWLVDGQGESSETIMKGIRLGSASKKTASPTGEQGSEIIFTTLSLAINASEILHLEMDDRMKHWNNDVSCLFWRIMVQWKVVKFTSNNKKHMLMISYHFFFRCCNPPGRWCMWQWYRDLLVFFCKYYSFSGGFHPPKDLGQELSLLNFWMVRPDGGCNFGYQCVSRHPLS